MTKRFVSAENATWESVNDAINAAFFAVEDCPPTSAHDFALIASIEHGVPVGDILAPTRGRPRAVKARRFAWRLAREAGWSYPKIGRAFNRDHSTIIQGLRDHAEN